MTSQWMTGAEIKHKDGFGNSLARRLPKRRFRSELHYEVRFSGLSPHVSGAVEVGRGRRVKPGT
jgi:hypothetical protein